MSSTDPPKKHPCPDCRFCQWCGDDRCSLCLGTRSRGRKMSLEEQIAFYEAVNATSCQRSGCCHDKEETDR
ncbi:hypothetical protein [Geobacter sp.]|uniref:hypothetical protein n=1 Tax=Geobacter sp. TaxID=46610 RepID=UPI00262E1ABD|nr:hypothetical protein [Geobacter sp.]